jgi:hypothetical protein
LLPPPVVLSHRRSSNRGCHHRGLIISLPPLSLHSNAPPNPDRDDDKDDNEDDEEDDDKDEGDVTTTFDKVAHCSRGDSYLAERAGTVAADQPVMTPPTNRTPMFSLAAATMAIDNTINDAIDETTTLMNGNELIAAKIAPFNEGPESD